MADLRHNQSHRHPSPGPRLRFWRLAGILALLGASVVLLAQAAHPVSAASAPTSGCTSHTVVPGDTLDNLAWTYDTTAQAIAQVNDILDPDLIYVGQRLCIPPHGAGGESGPHCTWHTVVPGDTLDTLGGTHGVPAQDIAQVNEITDPDLIYVGQHLCIPDPPGGPASSPTSGTSKPPAATATPVPSGAAAATPLPTGGSATGVQAFIQFVLPFARQAHAATGWPTSLILAQWGLEQGWHVPGYTGYNFGNCGAMPGEILVPGLNVPGSPAAFSYAPTPQVGVRIYVDVAHLSYYTAVAPAAASGGVDAAARALGQSPWDASHYTATGDPGSSLLQILHTYNLYRYDSQ